jgi:hypothetical protein
MNQYSLSPRKIALALVAVSVLLAIAGIFVEISMHYLGEFPLKWRLYRFFNMNGECNIPAWFATSLLLVSSLLLMIISCVKKSEHDSFTRHWQGLAFIFILLSIDEAAQLHEQLYLVTRYLPPITHGYGWIIPAMFGVTLFVLAYMPFLKRLPRDTSILIFLAGAIFIFGAVGMEIAHLPWQEEGVDSDMVSGTLIVIEEFLEKIGIVLFIYALTSYMAKNMKGTAFVFGEGVPFQEDAQLVATEQSASGLEYASEGGRNHNPEIERRSKS